MSPFQSVVQDLLLASGASRSLLQLIRPDGSLEVTAEAVTHGSRQLGHDPADAGLHEPVLLAQLVRDDATLTQDDLEGAVPAVPRTLIDRYEARARMVAPLMNDGRIQGVLSVHDVRSPRAWSPREADALKTAQSAALQILQAQRSRDVPATVDDLRSAGIQAILETLRKALRVQRCTLRQNVSTGYAFPVTHESRAENVRSLLGDFTIIQTGQPVIQKMLADRVQVIQHDTRNASDDPLFHVMLKHYGDMRAQIVTPLFRDGGLAAVLSVHSLKELRDWSPDETELARGAAILLGRLIGAALD